jgi:hypothetical protein
MLPRALGLAFLLAFPAAIAIGPSLLAPRTAEASVSVALTLEQLASGASHIVVATAVEKRSRWEELGGGRRIVTYTRLTVDQPVAGEPAKEIWVRTLGGVVDKIGQHVSGEAHLAVGAQSLLFLKLAPDGVLVVSGMAQGHYPIVKQPDQPPRLAPSPDQGAVLGRPGPSIAAREILAGATLADAIKAVQRARKVNDAKK